MQKTVTLVLLPEEAANEQIWKQKAIRKAGISAREVSAVIPNRRSIDARSRTVKINLQVTVFTENSELPAVPPGPRLQNVSLSKPVVIIGCGPAGLFAALKLIELGIKPVIIERGKDVRERRRDLADLNRNRVVNPDSNYCFGEGGAGTYSDGKLYTRSGKRGNIQSVLDTLIHFGASPDIAIDSHPHIGTNKLPAVISSIREAIVACGGEIHFNQRFSSLEITSGKLTGVNTTSVNNNEATQIKCKALILATGHSARDVFRYLHDSKIEIHSKNFALGVRIEHPQSLIDQIQYHCDIRSEWLPPSSYSLTSQAAGKGVYSFCMCPGGIIAAAATNPGEVVVNGWSPSKRNNPFANSGMVVSVDDEDFKPFSAKGELRAMYYQQEVEQLAFRAAGSDLSAPAQRVTDFLNSKHSSSLPVCSYTPGITSCNLDEILPKSVTDSLKEGLKLFGTKMKGYITSDAVLVATESRTSSPVRIPRDSETLMHPGVEGLFPCGEGAGYAGGIMSAAMDGEKCAIAVTEYIKTEN